MLADAARRVTRTGSRARESEAGEGMSGIEPWADMDADPEVGVSLASAVIAAPVGVLRERRAWGKETVADCDRIWDAVIEGAGELSSGRGFALANPNVLLPIIF